ncbi:hypothetical protein LINGRAHAP2_LOCUS7902 [Linum grandiflorum]
MGGSTSNFGTPVRGWVSESLWMELNLGEHIGWGADFGLAHDSGAAAECQADCGWAGSRVANGEAGGCCWRGCCV